MAREGVNASLVPPDDPVCVAEALPSWQPTYRCANIIRPSGRAHVEREFSAQRVAQAIVKLCNRLLDKAKPGA